MAFIGHDDALRLARGELKLTQSYADIRGNFHSECNWWLALAEALLLPRDCEHREGSARNALKWVQWYAGPDHNIAGQARLDLWQNRLLVEPDAFLDDLLDDLETLNRWFGCGVYCRVSERTTHLRRRPVDPRDKYKEPAS